MSTPQERVERFVEEHVGFPTVAILKSFAEWGLKSRTFMLREHAERLDALRARRGHFANYSDRELAFVESRICVEMVERICQLIEDFCVLTYALRGPLKDFPARLVHQPSPERVLASLDAAAWHELLRLKPLADCPLADSDRAFVDSIRHRNIALLQGLVGLMNSFLESYWLPYTKHKHGNTLLYGFERAPILGEFGIVIPVLYNRKDESRATGILFTPRLFEKSKSLVSFMVIVMKRRVPRGLRHSGFEFTDPPPSRERAAMG